MKAKGASMTIEIQQPELEQRLQGHLQTGRYHDTAELIAKALDALDRQNPIPHRLPRDPAIAALLDARKHPQFPEVPNVREMLNRTRS